MPTGGQVEPSAQLKAVPIGYNPFLSVPTFRLPAVVTARNADGTPDRLHTIARDDGSPGRWGHAGVFSVDGLAPVVHSGGQPGTRGCGQHVHKPPLPRRFGRKAVPCWLLGWIPTQGEGEGETWKINGGRGPAPGRSRVS